MRRFFATFAFVFALASVHATIYTNCAGLAAAVYDSSKGSNTFALSATVACRIAHEAGIMLLLFDGEHHALTHYIPYEENFRYKAGDRIRVTGTIQITSANPCQPVITNIQSLGRTKAPAFTKKRISDILNGDCDWQPALVRGTIRDVVQSETNPQWAYLMLCGTDGGVYVSVPRQGHRMSEFENLLGRQICAEGFTVPFDGSMRHHQGRILHCESIEKLAPTDRKLANLFDAPNISEIKNLHPNAIAALGLHRVCGTVLAVWRRNNALLRAPHNQIVRVEFINGPFPQTGQSIIAVGIPESDLFHANLTHARWKTTGGFSDRPPDATLTTAADLHKRNGVTAFDASWHGQRIRLVGIVRGVREDSKSASSLILEDNGKMVTVDLGNFENGLAIPPIGSRIEATGICVLDVPNWRSNLSFPKITGFTLVLDTPNGLKVLTVPSWWTSERLLPVIGALLTALFAFILWNVSLRRVAERKGRELLREQIKGIQSQLQVAERTRLSVELHDSLAQSLGGVAMELQTALASDPAAADGKDFHLAIAAQSLKSCRAELRNCLWDLRSEALDEPDMTRAIYRTLQPQINDARLQVRFNVPRARLSDTTAHAILRIVRELVVNALRHGRATVIRVAGSLDATQLMFAVRDNGCGFDPATCPGIADGHFGLQGIRERVERIGGEVRIDSTVGSGTRVTVTLPTHKLTQG